MCRARLDADWNRTAALMALLANCHRDPKKHAPYRADDFHPLRAGKRSSSWTRITADNIRILRRLVKQGGRRGSHR